MLVGRDRRPQSFACPDVPRAVYCCDPRVELQFCSISLSSRWRSTSLSGGCDAPDWPVSFELFSFFAYRSSVFDGGACDVLLCQQRRLHWRRDHDIELPMPKLKNCSCAFDAGCNVSAEHASRILPVPSALRRPTLAHFLEAASDVTRERAYSLLTESRAHK